MRRQRDQLRLQTVESWLEQFGPDVWALFQVRTGRNPSLASFESVYVWAFNHYARLRHYPSARLALVCRAAGAQGDMDEESRESDLSNETAAGNPDKESIPFLESLREPMDSLSAATRTVVLCYLFGDGDLYHLSRALLRPTGYLVKQLSEASRMLWPDVSDFLQAKAKWSDLRVQAQSYRDRLVVPAAAQVRVHKMLAAAMEQSYAARRHEGSRWWKYGTVLLAAAAVGAIGFGAAQDRTTISTPVADPGQSQDNKLPRPLGNFPGTIAAQFALPDDLKNVPLSHLVVTTDAVYFPQLKVAADTWPSIVVQKCDLTKTGEMLTTHLQNVAAVDMIPPTGPASEKKQVNISQEWSVEDWNYYVTGAWGVAVVRWKAPAAGKESITQLYTVYLPTGKSGLVTSYDAKTADEVPAVAVGEGKVVVQSAVAGGSQSSEGGESLSLPINVYTLSGSIPLKALGNPEQIPAPFGLMVKPVITGGALYFQGLQGQVQEASASNATWYGLTWDGHLSRYDGPPVDGRPHWALKGSDGTLWWVETTPDRTNPDQVQVLMSPAAADGQGAQTAAISLADSVQFCTVSNEYVVWVQQTSGTTQLVVGKLN